METTCLEGLGCDHPRGFKVSKWSPSTWNIMDFLLRSQGPSTTLDNFQRSLLEVPSSLGNITPKFGSASLREAQMP